MSEMCLTLSLQLNRANGPPSPQPAPSTLGRVAAVGPYIQVPVPSRQDGGYTLPPDPLKPQTLGVNNQANQGRPKSGGLNYIESGITIFPGKTNCTRFYFTWYQKQNFLLKQWLKTVNKFTVRISGIQHALWTNQLFHFFTLNTSCMNWSRFFPIWTVRSQLWLDLCNFCFPPL